MFSNFYLLSPQIGNRFALTAAHCLYDEDEEDEDRRELLPASSFSIMLGLHDRRKAKEPNRWLFHLKIELHYVCTRRQVRVSKVIVHENFTASVNDIALLKLGKKNLSGDPIHNQLTEERVDLSAFSPACLPGLRQSFNDQSGYVYGEKA